MSWQEYVDSNLLGTGNVTKAAILGHDGSQRAASPGFEITPQEAKDLIAGFNDTSRLLENGLYLGG